MSLFFKKEMSIGCHFKCFIGMAMMLAMLLVLLSGPAVNAQPSSSLEKHDVMLDWFPNADHVPLYVAVEAGFFAKHQLNIRLIAPADPNDALKLTAAGQFNFAINYQPSVIMARGKGLPIKSVGVLVDEPLSSLAFLKKSGIRKVSDLKGRTIGYSVQNLELALLKTMMAHYGIQPGEYKTINLNFNLVQPLLTGQVDAVIGAFWNYELAELELEGEEGDYFALPEHGIPNYDELVVISHDDFIAKHPQTITRFKQALQAAIHFTKANPDKALAIYFKANPQVRKVLDKRAFGLVKNSFADTQIQSVKKWRTFTQFALKNGLIPKDIPIEDLIVQ